MARKRGQNEGSIFKRKDGLWAAQVTIQGRHVSKYFKTQREARDWVTETRLQIDGGLTLTGAQVGLDTYLREWLEAHKLRVRPKTAFQYNQILEQHIIPTLGRLKLKDLRPEHIQNLYSLKIKAGISERTVLMIHAVIHRALEQAMKLGLVGRNAADAVTRPRFKRKEMKTLNDSQVRSFLSLLTGTRNDAFFWVAISTGLRQGELLGLKWADLDWRNRSIHVQRQVQRLAQGGLGFSEPKSDAGNRSVVLGKAVMEKLRAHIAIQDMEKSFAGKSWQEFDLIFPSTKGTPLDHRNIFRTFKDLLKQAGLPDIRFHDLRHTAATLMFKQGVHPKVVQERLGHSDIALTLNTYSHVMPSMQDDAADLIDEILVPIKVDDELKASSENESKKPTPKNEE
jgi:integrase